MTFHDAVLFRVLWDEARVVHLEFREVKDHGAVSVCIRGSRGFHSSGLFEAGQYISDVVFCREPGDVLRTWEGARRMWSTVVVDVNGDFLEVMGGEVEIVVLGEQAPDRPGRGA
ncbi:MAG: hypothetical protein MUC96_23005 [Myxococcaceae bacterium]|jgi:hypothetical protein|nr:hypothetical protein [Myxococcaceae bacterium]